jgi:hypothetical protein
MLTVAAAATVGKMKFREELKSCQKKKWMKINTDFQHTMRIEGRDTDPDS